MTVKNKILFYKNILNEIIETLATICIYLEYDSRRSNNPMGEHMRGHFKNLADYSQELRKVRKHEKR
jgi:hypothetical protein